MKHYPIIAGEPNKEEKSLCPIDSIIIGTFFYIPGDNNCICLKISQDMCVAFGKKVCPYLVSLKDVDNVYKEDVDIYMLEDIGEQNLEYNQEQKYSIHSFVMERSSLYYKICSCNKNTGEFYNYKVRIVQDIKSLISYFSTETEVFVLLNIL